jgi:glutathione peroxidase
MTLRQRLLKIIYPLWMVYARLTGKNISRGNPRGVEGGRSFYELETVLNDGSTLSFSSLRGKKVLLVNTASDCGYTNQYEALQELYNRFEGALTIVAFPANDFKEQEKGDDAEIAAFCKLNYGISFPLARKSIVKGNERNEVFRWLSDKQLNGWNDQQPTWNFSKYLVSEDGRLLRYFDPAISPLSEDMLQLIDDKARK